MAAEQTKTDASCTANESRSWPVSLLGCLSSSSGTSSQALPWLLFKSCLCPAAVLGENETLFQGEEPADVCCLQPYSFCGPTCRGLNAELCGLGNQGLKLCAHTCIMQLVCSCMCLGLPYVAWLAALQRQRVMTKHGVAAADEEAWATACYPCSLLQMHALLQLQQQQQASPRHQQHQQQQASVPLRAPRVQQMTAAASEAPSQASSYAGPLTSAITTSRVLRTVRDHAARSEGAAPPPSGLAAGGSARQGPRNSHDSGCSSPASETGVVNSPMMSKQQSEALELGSESSRSRGDHSAQHSRRVSACTSNDASSSSHKQHQQPPGGAYLRPPPPAAQQQQLGPLRSARGQSSSGGAAYGGLQPLLPPRPGMARHSRAASLGSEAAGGAAADAAGAAVPVRCSDAGTSAALGSELAPPETSSSAAVRSNKRKLPGRAAAASQSCHLPRGSSCLRPWQDGAPSTPPDAGLHAAAGAATAPPSSSALGADGSCTGAAGSATPVTPSGTPVAPLHSSCSKVPISGSCGRLVTFSQEDVPLSAFKAKAQQRRRASLGANPADAGKQPAGGWAWSSSKAGSLADSVQQQQQEEEVQQQGDAAAEPGSTRSGSSGEAQGTSATLEQQRVPRIASAAGAAPAGLAALVSLEADSSQVQVGDYPTMQSDLCNFASWLGEAPAGLSRGNSSSGVQPDTAGQAGRTPHQEKQQQEEEQGGLQQQRSEGDMCNYDSASTPAACSPKQAVSPAALSAGTGPVGATPAAAAESSAQGGSAARAAATAIANSSRPTVLAAAWAYMSDICNLGGSFDAAASAVGRTGLAAAVLSRLAEDSSAGQRARPAAPGTAAAGRPCSSNSGHSSSSVSGSGGVKQHRAAAAAAAAAAAGSWPDTAPSPPFATLATGGTIESIQESVGAGGADTAVQPQGLGASNQSTAADGSNAYDDDDDEPSSPPRRKRRAGSDSSSYGSGGDAAATSRPSSNSSNSTGGSGSKGQGHGGSRAGASHGGAASAVDGLDPQMLAAVIGTTQREQLTASQEELATKLARLAFANPAAARQLAGAQQQQQQRVSRGSRGGSTQPGKQQQLEQEQQQQLLEPFYPTVMSDMCNLADPEEQQTLGRQSSASILARRPPNAASAAQQQQQQWQAGEPAGQQGFGRPPMPPAAAAAGANSKLHVPAMPMRPQQQPHQQQQQQQVAGLGTASRLGRPAGMAAGPHVAARPGPVPASNAAAAVAAAAAASGSRDTAGPLRAALLLRGMRPPGGPKQHAMGGGGAAAGRLAVLRTAAPGDAAGDGPTAAAYGGVGPAPTQQRPGHDSLVSFDSFYVDCDLPPAPEPRCAAVEAANMITNNPLYTLAGLENGGTADSARMSPRLKKQLRQAAGAAAAGAAGEERPQQQQQQHWQASAGGTWGPKGAAVTAAAAGRPSSSDHDDGAQQPDNSRSNSPAPAFAGDTAARRVATGMR